MKAKNLITRTICSNSERSEQSLVTECFSNFLGVSRCDRLEQLEFKLEKNIRIQKHAGKVRKNGVFWQNLFFMFLDDFLKIIL